MASTYTLIERVTVGAAGSYGVTFNSIPQTYTDLVLKVSARSSRVSFTDETLMTITGASTGYYGTQLSGNGSSTSSYALSNGTTYINLLTIPGASQSSNTFGSYEIYFANYTSGNNKTWSVDIVSEDNATAAYDAFLAGYVANSAAITSINFSPRIASFVQGSTFSLYGISKASTMSGQGFPYATGGDIIQTDGTYWYHAFLTSGTFTPQKSLSCDVLIVGGGGGASSHQGGGGGAGGVLAVASQSLNSNSGYGVIVGAGGTGASDVATSGGNSQFGSYTALGGGAGGLIYLNGTAGGSGGGAGGGNVASYTGGAGTAGQGNAGGNSATVWYAGGGGGASANGGNATSSVAGAGGAGTNSVTGWGALSTALTTTGLGVSGYIAGGGGGGSNSATSGTGGSGGGGAGSTSTGTAGTPNTGSGAGGGGNGGSGSNGGSGLVIVRYAV
jgi:hypothetical protein